MGLTSKSTGTSVLSEMFNVQKKHDAEVVVALAGNPNTGKSTVFNSLTGLNQHTGNWPGKTVTNAQGRYKFKNKDFILVDLPGTYSLMSNSVEEEVARDFICFGEPQTTIVVTDATCLERNLNLALQILEITDKVVICVNLMDEAQRKKIKVDLEKLSTILGVPVIGTTARSSKGLDELMDAVDKVSMGSIETRPLKVKYNEEIEELISALAPKIQEIVKDRLDSRWLALRIIDGDKKILQSINRYLGLDLAKKLEIGDNETAAGSDINLSSSAIRDEIVSSIVGMAEDISQQVVVFEKENHNQLDRKIDKILTSRFFGIPIMISLLGAIFWFTIEGADYPSGALADLFFSIEPRLTDIFVTLNAPDWLHGILVLGLYRTLAWVVAVMLPPMAIFFPLFTLLEDLGYLPRVAFNLDNYFKKAKAHGKQALTMCMGFGCNAAGVIGCRIIDSPRERLIAIITNNFVPCNGRFPILIAVSTIFIAGAAKGPMQSLVATAAITGVIVLGVISTLIISRILYNTILKGLPSSFTLELPPYRKPQIGRVIVRSILDRTLFVLGRAVLVAAPAGVIIWIMANVNVGTMSLLDHSAGFLDPFANLIGLDGYILMAFILGLPANEIVMPIVIMSYMSAGAMLELDSLDALRTLLVENGWTWLTAVNVMLITLMHFPCGTTLLTIRKETQSFKWTLASFMIPTVAGIGVCFVFTQIVRLIGLA
ncbi:ferrous iron transport protein B [Alkalicella caledoniensis]|uniref:Ferrous iron transport protein B n=1 Tax=Alkalicella caledoniensis TaxID=2731377 RepID=A0A7G9W7B8_ALKCA|nr:ferrous iron transport protein B [Alkalicella caledoniensis]QNO14580.1 ferrous iron transport protein B [Alkalicella caledoniensis]